VSHPSVRHALQAALPEEPTLLNNQMSVTGQKTAFAEMRAHANFDKTWLPQTERGVNQTLRFNEYDI
jgi:hypothetical protein